jgi:hypothetical protein
MHRVLVSLVCLVTLGASASAVELAEVATVAGMRWAKLMLACAWKGCPARARQEGRDRVLHAAW